MKYWTQTRSHSTLIPVNERFDGEVSGMKNQDFASGAKPAHSVPTDEKLLVGREEAASMLSISCRSLDYLVANKQIPIRRIGTRVLIPIADLKRFSRSDHPERLAG